MASYGIEYTSLKEKYKKKLRNSSWYHGTSLAALKSLESKGPLADYNKGKELDFGHGFYLAPDLEMAKRYIEYMISSMKEMEDQFPFSDEDLTPIVIEYNLSDPIVEDYFKDPSYKTISFPNYSEDFARFILHNRLHPNESIHNFDLIYGVMSDSNPNILVPQVKRENLSEEEFVEQITKKTTSTRQLSIHNQSICDKLIMKAIHYVKEGVVRHVENSSHGQQ